MQYIPPVIKRLPLMLIILLSFALLYGCRSYNPVPERTVMRNLRREFPHANFEIIGQASRQVRVGQIGVDSIMRTVHDIHIVKCLDYDITFRTFDGSGRHSYLSALFESHVTEWNSQLSDILGYALLNVYTNADNHTTAVRYNRLSEGSGSSSYSAINSIEGSHIWFRDIQSFEEGFIRISNHDSVDEIILSVSYSVTLNTLDIESEIESIKRLTQQFVLPFYDLIYVEDRRAIIDLNVTFLKADSNNPDQDVRLGRFQWQHDSIESPALTYENIANFDLQSYFEISTIYDEFSLLETVYYPGHELLGAWGWNMQPIRRYYFNEDGTGRITYSGGRDFIWRILDDGNLLIAFDEDIIWTQGRDNIRIIYAPRSRVTPFAVYGNGLSFQPSGIRIDIGGTDLAGSFGSYMRVEWPSFLHGTWTWDIDPSWVLTMNSDGTGTRGFPEDIQSFRWAVETDNRRLWKVREDYARQHWSYSLNGDILTLTNWYVWQVEGQDFTYIPVR